MNRHVERKRYLSYWLMITLVITLWPAAWWTPVALAQGAPAPCLKDNGQPVQAAPVIGAWALVLNFNHAPSASTTLGCRVTTVALNPTQMSYTPIACSINNNLNGLQVGAGSAPFDGTFWVTCPNGPPVLGHDPLYDGFVTYGRAQFPTLTAAASFKLMQHPDVAVTAEVNASAQIKLTSRYGSYSYESTDLSTNVAAAPIFFASTVGGGMGRHWVNSNVFPFTTPVDQFPFDFTKPITFGKAQQPWTLYEIVVDPPPPRGGFSG